jgi:hypothetical protein
MLIEIELKDKRLQKQVQNVNREWEAVQERRDINQSRLKQLQLELEDPESEKLIFDLLQEIRNLKIELAEARKEEVRLLKEKNSVLSPAIREATEEAVRLRELVPVAIEEAKERLTAAGSGLETIPAGGVGIARLAEVNLPAARVKFEHLARQSEPVRKLLGNLSEAEARTNSLIQQQSNNYLRIDQLKEDYLKLINSI